MTPWTIMITLSSGGVVMITVDPDTDVVTIDPPVGTMAHEDVCVVGMRLVDASRIAGQRRASREARKVRASAWSIEQLADRIESGGAW